MQKNIKRVLRNLPQHWVGDGFPVRSLFSYRNGNEFDPFLLFDYAGPHQFGPTEYKLGVGEHPHKGFETVTILYSGELEHRDSSGGHGTLGPGDVQWMTAASGIVHEEFHSRNFAKHGGVLEMVQLWVNLPATAKKSFPKYQDLRSDQIPVVSLAHGLGSVRVIAGEYRGQRGLASTFSPINVWDIRLAAGGNLDLNMPDGHTSLLVVRSGQAIVSAELVSGVELVLFEQEGQTVKVQSEMETSILVLTGEPIREPVVGQGPFVMNTRSEINEAILEYRTGKMGSLA